MVQPLNTRPSPAFVGAAWAAMLVGGSAYLIGLCNSQMQLNEKGYYITVLLYACFSAVSLQKSVRDREEGLPVTGLYFGLCWMSVMASFFLQTVGLWNAALLPGEKGFYAMSFVLVLFAIVTVQKNVRDMAAAGLADTRIAG